MCSVGSDKALEPSPLHLRLRGRVRFSLAVGALLLSSCAGPEGASILVAPEGGIVRDGMLGESVGNAMPDGPLRSLLVDGIIAGLGMFGALAFQVARRTNELGMRIVLGASRRSMMGLVLRDVAIMLIPGIAIGAGAALMLTGMARAMLFELTPTDPGVFAVSASVLATAAVLAGFLPARRASRVDPMTALRHE